MELLPSDCLKIICKDISDKYFINLLITSKFMSSWRTHNLKVLDGCYKMSKIMNVINVFTFTNILYDYEYFDVGIIPKTIKKITFDDICDDKFDELFVFEIEDVNVGMFYENNCYGRDDMTMTIITNKVFSNLFNCSVNKLRANIKNGDMWFLLNFKRMWTSAYCKYYDYRVIWSSVYKEYYDFRIMDMIKKINSCINKANDYEYKFYRPNNTVPNVEFLNFHIEKIMIYLDKIKKMVCDKYDKVKCEFMGMTMKEMNMFNMHDIGAI